MKGEKVTANYRVAKFDDKLWFVDYVDGGAQTSQPFETKASALAYAFHRQDQDDAFTAKSNTPIQTDEHNGWANKETWATHLWLSNDEGFHSQARELAAEHQYEYTFQADDAVKEWVTELLDPSGDYGTWKQQYSMAKDIGSLWRVDWRAVADAFREEEAS